jgi:protein-S-isoprenylcysteine O-methyltransferase Ste14
MTSAMRKIHNPPVYFIASLGLTALLYYLLPSLHRISQPLNLSGLFLIFSGAALNILAHGLFHKHRTPHNFGLPVFLIEEGIFRYTRNPMYLGMALITFGNALCWGNIAGFVPPALFWLILQFYLVPAEEKRLKALFGQAYDAYGKRVHRWI